MMKGSKDTGLEGLESGDLKLVEAARMGDERAGQEIVDRYADRVFRIALRYARGNRETAKDLAQQAFLKVFRSLDDFGPPYNLGAWIKRIVHNIGIDHARERAREWKGNEQYASHQDFTSVTPEDELIRTECRSLLARALAAESDPECRETARLFYEEDRSVNEIALGLGASTTAVTSRLHRFRGRLRKLAARKVMFKREMER